MGDFLKMKSHVDKRLCKNKYIFQGFVYRRPAKKGCKILGLGLVPWAFRWYLDLLTDLGIGVMEAAGVKEQLLLLERKGKVTLLCMEPPNSSHIVAIRPRTYTPAQKKIDPKKRGFR